MDEWRSIFQGVHVSSPHTSYTYIYIYDMHVYMYVNVALSLSLNIPLCLPINPLGALEISKDSPIVF